MVTMTYFIPTFILLTVQSCWVYRTTCNYLPLLTDALCLHLSAMYYQITYTLECAQVQCNESQISNSFDHETPDYFMTPLVS